MIRLWSEKNESGGHGLSFLAARAGSARVWYEPMVGTRLAAVGLLSGNPMFWNCNRAGTVGEMRGSSVQ